VIFELCHPTHLSFIHRVPLPECSECRLSAQVKREGYP